MFLNLIEVETSKRWPLIVCKPEGVHNFPTIDQHNRDPTQWDTIPHGYYEISAEIGEIRTQDDGFMMFNPNTRERVSVKCSTIEAIHNIHKGLMVYNNGTLTIQGRFKKQGSEINFYIMGKE